MQSFSAEQQKQAILSQDKGRNNIAAEAFSDNKTVDFQGLSASKMTTEQKEQLLDLANQYISIWKIGMPKLK